MLRETIIGSFTEQHHSYMSLFINVPVHFFRFYNDGDRNNENIDRSWLYIANAKITRHFAEQTTYVIMRLINYSSFFISVDCNPFILTDQFTKICSYTEGH